MLLSHRPAATVALLLILSDVLCHSLMFTDVYCPLSMALSGNPLCTHFLSVATSLSCSDQDCYNLPGIVKPSSGNWSYTVSGNTATMIVNGNTLTGTISNHTNTISWTGGADWVFNRQGTRLAYLNKRWPLSV